MKHLLVSGAVALMLLTPLGGQAQSPGAPEPDPAIEARLADQSLLLDVIRYDDGYVAAGQRGHVLVSEDGMAWSQVDSVPVQSTLTRLERQGRRMWAVGHDSVILSSADGGQTWFIQNWAPAVEDPDTGFQESDTALLDVEFLTALKGFAVGAYGRILSTSDGGVTWTSERIEDRLVSEAIDWTNVSDESDELETMPDSFEPETNEMMDGEELFIDKGCYEFYECHLNDLLVMADGRLMIAAERGYGYRSTDEGETWESFRFPYSGSMFGVIELDDCVVAFGLRGNIQRSCDFGNSWSRLEYDGDQTLMGATTLSDGRVLMVGAAASRVTLSSDGSIEMQSDRLGSDYAAVVAGDSGLIVVGEDGVRNE